MSATALPADRAGRNPGLARLFGMISALGRWYIERRTMAALARLDPHLLRDIGLPPVPALEEVRRRLAGG